MNVKKITSRAKVVIATLVLGFIATMPSAHAAGTTSRTLTWTLNPTAMTYGQTLTLSQPMPSASDANDVITFQIKDTTNTAGCSVDQATQVLSVTSIGTCDVRAKISGSSVYVDAFSRGGTEATVGNYWTLTVQPISRNAVWSSGSGIEFTNKPVTVVPAITMNEPGPVTYSVDTTSASVCALDHQNSDISFVLNLFSTGACKVTANIPASGNYASGSVTRSLTISNSTDTTLASFVATDLAGNPLKLYQRNTGVIGFDPSIRNYSVEALPIGENSALVTLNKNNPTEVLKLDADVLADSTPTTIPITSKTTTIRIGVTSATGATRSYYFYFHKPISLGGATVGVARTVTASMQNTSDGPALIDSITLEGPDASLFQVVPGGSSPCPLGSTATVSHLTTCTVSISFLSNTPIDALTPARATILLAGHTATGGTFIERASLFANTNGTPNPSTYPSFNSIPITTTSLPDAQPVAGSGAATYSVVPGFESACTLKDANHMVFDTLNIGECQIYVEFAQGNLYAYNYLVLEFSVVKADQPVEILASATNVKWQETVTLTTTTIMGSAPFSYLSASENSSDCVLNGSVLSSLHPTDCRIILSVDETTQYSAKESAVIVHFYGVITPAPTPIDSTPSNNSSFTPPPVSPPAVTPPALNGGAVSETTTVTPISITTDLLPPPAMPAIPVVSEPLLAKAPLVVEQPVKVAAKPVKKVVAKVVATGTSGLRLTVSAGAAYAKRVLDIFAVKGKSAKKVGVIRLDGKGLGALSTTKLSGTSFSIRYKGREIVSIPAK